ncbi:hypothetical protein ACWC09_49285 [Streptomyces sp. NPDC001617]
MIAESFAGPLPGSFAQGLGRIVDAGDVRTRVDGRVVALRDLLQASPVEDDTAPVACAVPEVLQAPGRFGGGRAGQAGVLVGVDEGQKMLAPGEGLLAFDLGVETGVAGACVASKTWMLWWRY